jgi:GAF domain-containing protein
MRFLIVRTDIRTAAAADLAALWTGADPLRDEQTAPEHRRQTVHAEDLDAALVLARALSTVGAVRSGRQRVKVVSIGEPERRSHSLPRPEWPPGIARHPRPTG